MAYRAELHDIRKLLSQTDLDYVAAHTKSLKPGQFTSLSAKYGGWGSGNGGGIPPAIKIALVAICTAIPMLGIAYLVAHRKKK